MGNCYVKRDVKRQRIQTRDKDDYIDKNIRVQRKIGAEISISKTSQKIGLDTNMSGIIESNRQETYKKSDSLCNNIDLNHIPRVLELVNQETQTT